MTAYFTTIYESNSDAPGGQRGATLRGGLCLQSPVVAYSVFGPG